MSFTEEHLAGRPDLVRRVFDLGGISFNGRHRGAEWSVLCPFHPDQHPSLDINMEKAVFICRSCGAGGDAIDFYAKVNGLTPEDAIAELRDRLGIKLSPNGSKGKGNQPKRSWPIRNAAGDLVALHHFLGRDARTGKKLFAWEREGKRGLDGLPVADLPLYGSERISVAPPDAPVIVVEGEKATDALLDRGYIALGTVTGASATPGVQVLDVLRGRRVVVWPDNDRVGREHMKRIAAALFGIASSVQCLTWGEKKHDDAVDFFERGGVEEQLDQLLSDANEVRPIEIEEEEGPDDDPIVSLAYWDKNPAPEPDYIIEGLIARESTVATIGRPYGGKSISALNRGLCMAAGVDWLGFRVRKTFSILYIDEEMGRLLMEMRLKRMRVADPQFQNLDVARRFHVASRAGFRLDDEKWRARIRRFLGKHKVDHVMWDTLRRLHSGNEDRSEEMAPLFAFLAELRREFGISNEVIHHTKKNPSDEGNWMDAARGSGDIVAATNAVLGIWRLEDGLFTFRADSKAGGEVEPRDLQLDPETLWLKKAPEGAVREAAKESALREAEARICKALRKVKERGPGAYPPSWNELAAAAKGNADTLRSARKSLERQGTIVQAKRRGKGGGTVWLFAEDLDEWNRSGSASGTASDTEDEN